MKDLTDEQIMISVSSGNLDLASILFDRYQVRIYNYLLKMTRDEIVSQDITQEVFYKMIKYRRSYKEGKFSAWIYTIARNIFMDYYQKQKNKDVQLNAEIYGEEDKNYSEINETNEQLYRALNGLNKSDKELIVMNRFQNIKYKEIAQILGSTEGAVKTKIHRAIFKLKELYLQNA